jgi:hypothetical protein
MSQERPDATALPAVGKYLRGSTTKQEPRMARARKTNQYGENDDRFRFSNEDQDHRFSWQDGRWNDDDHGHHPHHGHGRGHDHSDGRGHDRHHDDHRLDWQNARFDRHDDRLRVDEDDYTTTFGSLDPSSTEDGTYLWVGTGNSATNFNTFVNQRKISSLA